MIRSRLAILGLLALAGPAAMGSEPDRYDRFFREVKPVLMARCVSCHGPDKQEGKLRLDSAEGLTKGGASGPAIDRDDPKESLILKAVRHDEDVSAMPPKERLRDDQIAALSAWVHDGAVWPETVQVLVDDEAKIASALTAGEGSARFQGRLDPGKSALVITGQKQADRILGWDFRVREHPQAGEYRYFRFAWRKREAGGMMVELARDGGWRNQGETNAAWVAGLNTTGWPAISLGEQAPADWTVVTRDLWADGGSWGDWSVTGVGFTSIGGGEFGVDAMILGPTIESLDAYKPGRGRPAFAGAEGKRPLGDAWTDPENPIRRIFGGERLDLWSLRKPVRPLPPMVGSSEKPENPIDRFVLAKLEAAGLMPSPEADRRTLIRRLSFDLTGLPPSPGEMKAFLEDRGPDAYERLVDRLLASPRYGEKWGRAWLDVVRYADSNGFERDEFRPNMWRYRDYVIRSLNADKPYDRFVTEQLAGDEVAPGPVRTLEDADRVAATGYLRLGTFDSTTSLFTEDKKGRDELMADLANTTGAAFLGLTMSCCQCHDHKYDPLSQADHFRMRAFFAAVKPTDDEVISLPEEREAIETHNADVDRRMSAVQAARETLLEPPRARLVAEKQAALPGEIRKLLDIPVDNRDAATKEKLKPFQEGLKVHDDGVLAALPESVRKQAESFAAEVETIKKSKRSPATARVMTDAGRSAPPTHVFFQGDFTQPRDAVEPGYPSVLDPNPAVIESPATESTGRRLTLARWITSRENPWTARVVVNRIWQGYFGRGLVATANDLGYAGARPSHPELLDWLATELMDHGWSLKHAHRLIVTSATYRQSSLDDPVRRSIDPENRLLWRQEIRRLDAESLRDALLVVSGRLLPVDSGPPRWPPVAEAVLEVQPAIIEARHDDGGRLQNWYAEPAETTDVRSVFLVQKRSVPLPLLLPFDLPDTTVSCARRSSTTVAPQALTLLNNPDVVRWSRAFAGRVATQAGATAPARVITAFRLGLQRDPQPAEQALALDLLQRNAAEYARDEASKFGPPDRRALADLCRAIMNVNEFLYID
jgi:mono/diheme cytochrome c family protein